MNLIWQSRRSETAAQALPQESVLTGQWELMEIAAEYKQILRYLAQGVDTEETCAIVEYLPETDAIRAQDGVTVEPQGNFAKGKTRFLKAANALLKNPVPYLPVFYEVFEENGTVYCTFQQSEGESLAQTDFPRTATYIRSLGIALCDTYIALHRMGLLCGRLSASQILLASDGTFTLCPDCILEAAADGSSDTTEDMHILTTFLSGLCGSMDEEEEDAEILRNVLQYGYQDAELLRSALICEENSLAKPRTARTSVKPLLRFLLCLLFLAAAAAGVFWLGRNHLPLGLCVKLGLVQDDVISVWMPIEPALDEMETQAMYQALTTGFENKYPGCGVNLVIYADDSFDDALLSTAEPPTVFMNTQNAQIVQNAADLSLLTRSLPDNYLVNLHSFTNTIPLGCSLTALYYNASSCEMEEADFVEYADIAEDIPYDSSAEKFLAKTDSAHTRQVLPFTEFLASRSDAPLLAGTSRIAIVERNALTSGAVRMLPVSVDGSYPLQAEMCCTVNADVDWNSQRIGMLWIQYLLTEEAQQIMFAEYYSALPIHDAVFAQTIENHDALSFISTIRDDIDGSALQ